jgi:HlyD family secretion protein
MKTRHVTIICSSLLISSLLSGCSQQSTHEIDGYIEGNYTYISSPVSGVLDNLAVNRGDSISKNYLLFKLDKNPQLEERDAAKANWLAAKAKLDDLLRGQRSTVVEGILAQKAQAQASLKLSKATLSRYLQLYDQHVIAKEAYDKATADYKTNLQKLKQINANLAEAKLGARKNQILAQEAMVQSAKINVKELDWTVQQKTVVASESGVVFDTYYQKGEFVPAGKPVLSYLSPKNIKIIFYVSEQDLTHTRLRHLIEFRSDTSHWQKAKINYISSQAEYTPPVIYSQKSRDKLVYRIEAAIPKDKALQYHPGQPVDIRYD